mgnify:CR=1 FL=1
MKITTEMAAHIAALSRLKLSEEAGRMAGELEQILSYMDVLDTSGAEPMSHIVPLKNVLREDETAPSMDRGELLKNAPATDGGTFLVPKAVE